MGVREPIPRTGSRHCGIHPKKRPPVVGIRSAGSSSPGVHANLGHRSPIILANLPLADLARTT